jgi:hypothetical protein
MKPFNYRGHLIVLKYYSWGYEMAAIPDNGETIRKKFIGYSLAEMVSIMKKTIRGENAN